MIRLFSSVFFLLLTLQGFTQDYKRTFNWYFGDSAGISFATNPPTPLSNGKMFTDEGCASISDINGNLLFYTNGEKVWNKNHEIMEMGDALLGSTDATQSSIIVPQPGADSIYYIFTTPTKGLGGLRYSIVNISANSGLGKVISRNILLQSPVCEKLTATHHQNGKDIWVVAHGFKDPGKDNLFYSYLITENGLVNCPVLTNIGAEHYKFSEAITNAQGAMKFSPSGKTIAITVYNRFQNYVELLKFNKSSGTFYDLKRITDIFLPYGIEFSPNEKKLYVATRSNYLYQYNLDLPNESEISNSRTELYWPGFNSPSSYHTSIQTSSNGKIYIALVDSSYISVINQPDSLGSLCDFQIKGIQLSANKTSKYGLPNFVTSYYYRPKIDFSYKKSCNSTTAHFQSQLQYTPSSINWKIKRLFNGHAIDYSTPNITHQFNDSGLYEVRLIADNDTIIKTIYIDAPILPLSDTLGCGVDSVVLNVPSSYRCLQWSDTSAQLYSRTIKSNGTYKVQGYNSHGCLITDSIRINFTPSPIQPAIMKVNDSLKSTPSFAYQWLLNDTALAGANSQSIKPLVAGMYKVLITDSNGCSNVSTPYSSNVGINELYNDEIKVYPNPAGTTLTIELNITAYNLNITDITGRVVYNQTSISNSSVHINCKPFHKGIYFIQIKNLNTTYVKKLIIQ